MPHAGMLVFMPACGFPPRESSCYLGAAGGAGAAGGGVGGSGGTGGIGGIDAIRDSFIV